MIKKIILISALILTQLFSQSDEQNPNVELPDFVITGTDILSVQKAGKITPEFVSTLSEETLKPVYPVEQLEMKEISNPVKDDVGMFDTLNYYSGKVKAGAGFYTLPLAELKYAVPFSSGIFEAYAGGKNTRSYVTNSGRYNAAAGLNLNLFTSDLSSFLPGSQFRFHGDYGTSAFKFYGGPDPSLKREIQNGNIAFEFNSLSGRMVTAGLKVQDEIYRIEKEGFTENFISTGAFVKVNLINFNISLNGEFDRQMLTLDTADYRHSLFALRPAVGINISRTVKTSLGLTYAESGDESFLAPYAAVTLRFNKNFSAFGEYSPAAKLYTSGHFLSVNRFFDIQNFGHLYSEEVNLTGSLKYEYDKYFQIDGGMRFKSSDRLPYFSSDGLGKFNINYTEGQIITAFANFLFHRGPYGRFYGTVELTSANDSADYRIPYYSNVSADLSYGYTIGLMDFHTTLYYNSEVFTGVRNSDKLMAFIDLGAGIDLKLNSRFSLFFEVNNILSNNNFIWRGYKEPPLDLLGGFIYRW